MYKQNQKRTKHILSYIDTKIRINTRSVTSLIHRTKHGGVKHDSAVKVKQR